MSLLSPEQISSYEEDGYVIVRGLFSTEETQLLRSTANHDNAMDKASSSMDDGKGNEVRLALWNHPGEGIYGMFARCKRVVDSVEQLLNDEAYHYHSKMILKDAKVKLYDSNNHVGDFLNSMKSRKKPITNEVVGARTSIACHLLNQTYYNQTAIAWDPKKNTFAKDGDPRWLTRNYRGQWKV